MMQMTAMTPDKWLEFKEFLDSHNISYVTEGYSGENGFVIFVELSSICVRYEKGSDNDD